MKPVQPDAQKVTRVSPGAGALRKVTAIIRVSALEQVERRLQELGVPGVTVTKVKGYGEYANFFARDWLVEHVRIEIFLTRERAAEIARAIAAVARTGFAGDGIVVVLPVEAVYHVRTGELAASADLGGCQCVVDDAGPESGDAGTDH